ncbi:hypothetical protein [Hwangdonia sp.]|uniref:hypothetical protein n=1 Tax=Hwangdonia sp. TaxID=1883432 RepID=UPI003AB40BC3
METLNVIKKSIVITFASIILACGAETLAAIVFIPAFTAGWPVVGVPDYTINLQSDDEGLESGIIFGDESNHPTDADKQFNTLDGSFNGLNIEFTINRPNDVKMKYTGKMIPISDENHTIIRMELNSSEGALVLGSE